MREEWEKEFKKLNLKKYITVNCGNGVGYSNVSKQWPAKNFVQLVREIKKIFGFYDCSIRGIRC